MQVDPTTNKGSTQTSALSAKSTTSKDEFLNLLVIQLKNQDPLDPMKNENFLTQLAQFSSLESLQNIDKQAGYSSTAEAAGLIGKTVNAESEDYGTVSGKVEAVEINSSGTLLQIGSALISLDEVTGVK